MNAKTFPDFYCECAYLNGQSDATSGHSDSRPSYMRWGYPEPKGMRWYEAGRASVAA